MMLDSTSVKGRILDAAAQAFATHGVDQTSIEAPCFWTTSLRSSDSFPLASDATASSLNGAELWRLT